MVTQLAPSHLRLQQQRSGLQDELDDILRYGAAELFADAVAASKTQAQQVAAVTGRHSCTLHFVMP